jgi:hypothetical protein
MGGRGGGGSWKCFQKSQHETWAAKNVFILSYFSTYTYEEKLVITENKLRGVGGGGLGLKATKSIIV